MAVYGVTLSALVTCDQVPISAAVWSIRPNVQVLSAALPLFWHHIDMKMRAMAAHHFGALRNGIPSFVGTML